VGRLGEGKRYFAQAANCPVATHPLLYVSITVACGEGRKKEKRGRKKIERGGKKERNLMTRPNLILLLAAARFEKKGEEKKKKKKKEKERVGLLPLRVDTIFLNNL